MNLPELKHRSINCQQSGFSYVEILIAVTIAGILISGLMGVINSATQISDDVLQRNDLTRQARFAMQRMVRNVSHSRRLLLPLNDNPNTNWSENIREQTIPATAPIGDSTLATAVLVVTLPADVDRDSNGYPDADNDNDGLIDEDLGDNNNNDGAPGIALIDDNGDGSVDNSTDGNPLIDNDEDHSSGEDIQNGIDDDLDGNTDEDLSSDMNGDTQRGIAGVDDNADGIIDQGDAKDDDEDGSIDEDWFDTVVFYLDNGSLKERTPVPWDTNADTVVTGADFIESVIADNVTHFRVERLNSADSKQLVDLILELTDPNSGETISLQTRVRVGGAL